MTEDFFGHLAPEDRITYSRAAAKAFRRVQPRKQREAIRDAIVDLVSEPRPDGCKKLTNGRGAYRIRVGDYRVIYEIHEDRIKIQVSIRSRGSHSIVPLGATDRAGGGQ